MRSIITAAVIVLAGCHAPDGASPQACAEVSYSDIQPAELLVSADDGETILTVWRDASGVVRVLEATKNGPCEIYTGTDFNGAIPI